MAEMQRYERLTPDEKEEKEIQAAEKRIPILQAQIEEMRSRKITKEEADELGSLKRELEEKELAVQMHKLRNGWHP